MAADEKFPSRLCTDRPVPSVSVLIILNVVEKCFVPMANTKLMFTLSTSRNVRSVKRMRRVNRQFLLLHKYLYTSYVQSK